MGQQNTEADQHCENGETYVNRALKSLKNTQFSKPTKNFK